MLHKYKIRQMVRLVRAPISDSRASGSGIYEVDAPHAGRRDR